MEDLAMSNNVQLYCFSPTGGTRACGEIFCKGISRNINTVNLGSRSFAVEPEYDLAVFALPVFGGRIPAVAAEKIGTLDGTGKKAITLVVYGTRAYEDALLELNDVVASSGFRIIASGAVVARHSIVPAVGRGRPDRDDEKSLAEFAEKVLKKLESGEESPVSVPGNFPYRNAMNVPATPVCLPECIQCGKCVSICPVAAIRLEDDGIKTDVDTCIPCMACTSACPEKARVLPTPLQENMNEKMAALIPVRRENEYFL